MIPKGPILKNDHVPTYPDKTGRQKVVNENPTFSVVWRMTFLFFSINFAENYYLNK